MSDGAPCRIDQTKSSLTGNSNGGSEEAKSRLTGKTCRNAPGGQRYEGPPTFCRRAAFSDLGAISRMSRPHGGWLCGRLRDGRPPVGDRWNPRLGGLGQWGGDPSERLGERRQLQLWFGWLWQRRSLQLG